MVMTHEEHRVLMRLFRGRIRPALAGIDTAHPIAPEDIAEVERRLVCRALQEGRNPNSPEVAAWRAYTRHYAQMLVDMMGTYVEMRAVAKKTATGATRSALERISGEQRADRQQSCFSGRVDLGQDEHHGAAHGDALS
jgi:hypothetical protein